MTEVAASILSADFANLGKQVQLMCKYGADFIHVDVMDGHFVKNLTFGPLFVSAIKKYASVPLDVHLMMDNVSVFIDDFINAGADRISIHLGISDDVKNLLKHIKSKGVKVGLCISPSEPASLIIPFLTLLDFVLVMTVEPGFAGQKFMDNQLQKIEDVKKIVQDYPVQIEVDGGINDITGKAAVKAGADILVAGSYIFNSKKPQNAIVALKGLSNG